MIVVKVIKLALLILVATAMAQGMYAWIDIDFPGASCADIYNKNPTSHDRSGYYVLKTDHLFFAYCDMELDCYGNKGGWMRIADINKGDTCLCGWTIDTTLTIWEVQQVVVILLTFQQTPQVTVRCVGK